MMSNLKKVTPPKFNRSPLKNDAWKTILSFWGPGEILELQVGDQLLTPQVLKLSDFQTQEKNIQDMHIHLGNIFLQ